MQAHPQLTAGVGLSPGHTCFFLYLKVGTLFYFSNKEPEDLWGILVLVFIMKIFSIQEK